MTHSFMTHLSRGICLLALCLGQVLTTLPAVAATTATSAASKGTQETIKGGIDYAGRGLGDLQTGVKTGSDTANSLLGAADSIGVDTGGLGGQLGSVTGGLTTGKNALDTAGKLAGTDFGNFLPSIGNGKFDYSKMTEAFGSALGGMGKAFGNKWDSLKGISVSGIWGDTTNFMKDLTPDIKGLTAEKLMAFDFSGLDKLFPAGGIPSILVDLEPLNIYTVVATEGTFASKEEQLAYEQAYTPTIGPVGVMDGRMGICQVNGHDYTGMMRAYLAGPGKENEGFYPFLHLDSVCVLTVGIGTALSNAGDKTGSKEVLKQTKDAQLAYFKSFEYEPKSRQDPDFEIMWQKRKECLASCGGELNTVRCKYNGTEDSQAKFTTGRLTETETVNLALSELCNNVRSYDANFKKNGGNFALLPLQHQFVVLDIGYQCGPGCITSCQRNPATGKGCLMPSGYSTPFKQQLIAKSCSPANGTFNSSPLGQSKYANRNAWRRGAIMAPCGGGV